MALFLFFLLAPDCFPLSLPFQFRRSILLWMKELIFAASINQGVFAVFLWLPEHRVVQDSLYFLLICFFDSLIGELRSLSRND